MSYEQDWNDLAALDPFWAIMSDARHKHGGWDVDAFFATGELEVAELMAQAADLGGPGNFRTALDFGCGVGRTTRAFAKHFDHCTGLDVSLEMVKLARELNSAVPGCDFVHSTETNLSRFDAESFDFIYCNIVLQHLSDRQVIRRYLSEFIRVLTAGGLLVFRLPTTLPLLVRLQPRRTLYGLLRRAGMSPRFLYFRLGLHPISMTAMAEAEVRASLGAAGAETTTVQPGMDPNFDFASTTYFVTRSPRANDAARLRTDAVDG
jgi:SAM-dependent methyltransferase